MYSCLSLQFAEVPDPQISKSVYDQIRGFQALLQSPALALYRPNYIPRPYISVITTLSKLRDYFNHEWSPHCR